MRPPIRCELEVDIAGTARAKGENRLPSTQFVQSGSAEKVKRTLSEAGVTIFR
jgi:hypothetical protein